MGIKFDSLETSQQLDVIDYAKMLLTERGFKREDVTDAEIRFLHEFIAADPKEVRNAQRFCNSNKWIEMGYTPFDRTRPTTPSPEKNVTNG